MSDDSKGDVCANCRFVVTQQSNLKLPPDYGCRRFPPIVMAQALPQPGIVGGKVEFEWLKASTIPLTRPNNWCGEFQPKLAIAKLS